MRKVRVVALRICRGGGGFGRGGGRFLGVGWREKGLIRLGWRAPIGAVHVAAMAQVDPAGIVEGIDMHACNYGQREYSSKPRKNASGC